MLQRVLALIVLIGCLQFHPSIGDDPITSSITPAQDGVESSAGAITPLVARFLWEEAPKSEFREEVDRDVHTFDTDIKGEEGASDDALMLEVDFGVEGQEVPVQLARYLWEDGSSEGNTKGIDADKEVQPTHFEFVGDAWLTNEDLLIARYLWEDESGQSQPQVPQVGRFLWQETPSSREPPQWNGDDLYKDVRPALMEDTVAVDDGLMLARYLWEDEQGSSQPAHPEPARFLWQEAFAPETETDLMLARYLWEDGKSKQPSPPVPDRYLWEDEKGSTTPPVPDVARYLWEDESGKTTPPAPELARFLWDEATPDTDVQSESAGESRPVESEVLLARYLWEDESGTPIPSEPQQARYLWDEATPDKDVQPNYQGDTTNDGDEVLLARYLWSYHPGN